MTSNNSLPWATATLLLVNPFKENLGSHVLESWHPISSFRKRITGCTSPASQFTPKISLFFLKNQNLPIRPGKRDYTSNETGDIWLA
jgi:hypothetical protein